MKKRKLKTVNLEVENMAFNFDHEAGNFKVIIYDGIETKELASQLKKLVDYTKLLPTDAKLMIRSF